MYSYYTQLCEKLISFFRKTAAQKTERVGGNSVKLRNSFPYSQDRTELKTAKKKGSWIRSNGCLARKANYLSTLWDISIGWPLWKLVLKLSVPFLDQQSLFLLAMSKKSGRRILLRQLETVNRNNHYAGECIQGFCETNYMKRNNF